MQDTRNSSLQDTKPFPLYANARIFALVIGINDYKSVSKLKGAVADADAIDQFLQTRLGVPINRIKNLRDKGAMREAIIREIDSLKKNPDIGPEDPIFIYYAGHGCEKDMPSEWAESKEKVQAIVPQDTDILQATGQRQQGHIDVIPDRTIRVLLNNLARLKSNNITVVFDCCHSFSGARGEPDGPDSISRQVQIPGNLPTGLDQKIIDAQRHVAYSPGFFQSDLRSHVMLAACGATGLAWEVDRRGVFTKALIETFIAFGEDHLTYARLTQKLPTLTHQTPHCEGHFMDRTLFSKPIPDGDQVFFRIEKEDDKYTLYAGRAQGITPGSEFNIYENYVIDPKSYPSWGTLVVKSTADFTATLEPLDGVTFQAFPPVPYARQVRTGPGQELRVHIRHEPTCPATEAAVRGAIVKATQGEPSLVLTDVMKDADLLVDVRDLPDGPKATFKYSFAEENLRKLPYEAPAEVLSDVLPSMALWHWHLKRENDYQFDENIRVKFVRLTHVAGRYYGDGLPIWAPGEENLNNGGIVDLILRPARIEVFGLEITNNTGRDLYPYLFYFDVSDQSIEPRYRGPSGKEGVDAPLAHGSSLQIGYGAAGEEPFMFHLRDGEDVDIGVLKVFLTDERTDFTSLKQASPFDFKAASPDAKESPRATGFASGLSYQDMFRNNAHVKHWGAVKLTIIQRRFAHIVPGGAA